MTEKEEKRVKKLLDKGYKPNYIATEFEIPLESIIEYQKRLKRATSQGKQEKSVNRSTTQKIEVDKPKIIQTDISKQPEQVQTDSSVSNDKPIMISIEELTEQQKEMVETSTELIIQLFTKGITADNMQNEKSHIRKSLDVIQVYPLTLEQMTKLVQEVILKIPKEKVPKHIRELRDTIGNRILELLRNQNVEISAESQFKKLNVISNRSDFSSPVLNQINFTTRLQLEKIQQLKAIAAITNIHPSIEQMLHSMVSGEVDFDEVDKLIDEEAQRRVNSSPKTAFSLSFEKQKEQIKRQIKRILVLQAKKYNITDLMGTETRLKRICNIDREEAVNIIIDNLLSQRKYAEAYDFCDKLLESGKMSRIDVRVLKKGINKRELEKVGEVAVGSYR